MPFSFQDKDILPELEGSKSALIIPCRFCPAASAAVKNGKPYFEFFRRILQTAPYEQQISSMQSRLEDEGIHSGVFKSRILHQFILCMWTERRRQKLRKEAAQYEAAIVLGCEAAVQTVTEALTSTGCQVVQGMKTEGIMNVIPKFQLPGKLWLKLMGVNKVLHQD